MLALSCCSTAPPVEISGIKFLEWRIVRGYTLFRANWSGSCETLPYTSDSPSGSLHDLYRSTGLMASMNRESGLFTVPSPVVSRLKRGQSGIRLLVAVC